MMSRLTSHRHRRNTSSSIFIPNQRYSTSEYNYIKLIIIKHNQTLPNQLLRNALYYNSYGVVSISTQAPSYEGYLVHTDWKGAGKAT